MHIFVRVYLGCLGVHRQDGVRVNMYPPLTEDAIRVQKYVVVSGAPSCVPMGLRIPIVSLLDREHREFSGTEQERLRCFHQTDRYMIDDRLRGVSPLNPLNPLRPG